MSNLGRTMRNGAAWLFLGNGGSQVLNFLFGIALARLLAPADFGLLLTVQIFTGLAGYVAGGGMGQALVRAHEVVAEDYRSVFTLQLLIGCAIYASFFTAAPWIAAWYEEPAYVDLLRVSTLSFLFRPLVNVPSNMLYRAMRFKAQTLINFATIIATNASSVSLAYLGYGVWSLVWSGIVGSTVACIALCAVSGWRPSITTDLRRAKALARYGMLVSANDIVEYLRKQVGIFTLSHTLGVASVGLYNKGESLAQMPTGVITGAVYQVLFRALAVKQDDPEQSRYLFFRTIMLVAVYVTPFYVGLHWLAPSLVHGIYGAKWAPSIGPLSVLVFAWPCWLVETLSGAVLASHNWLHRELPVQISIVLISALGIVIALPYGLEGVAWAIVGAAAYSCVYLYSLATRCLRASPARLLGALSPATVLNALLALALWCADRALPVGLPRHSIGFALAMTLIGGSVYALSFLFLPIPALASERRRWKQVLRMQRPLDPNNGTVP